MSEPSPKEKLLAWLRDVDGKLAALRNRFPTADRVRLDGSLRSLDQLEQWLLARYDDLDDACEPDEEPVMQELTAYIGDAVRTATNGRWEVRPLDREDPYAEQTVIVVGEGPKPAVSAPLEYITFALEERTGTWIREQAEAFAKKVGGGKKP